MGTAGSLYETVTQAILDELERGVPPWIKPWSAGQPAALPRNAISQRPYHGVNVLLLWMMAAARCYGSPTWLTFKQAGELGGRVRKGEKATHIVYAASVTKSRRDAESGETIEESIPFLRWYTVFNTAQVEGLPEHLYQEPAVRPLPDALAQVEAFLAQVPAEVRHGGDRAFYVPRDDFIGLPVPSAFETAGHYYATSLHEHGHWTAHPSRLDRDLSGRFGSAAYAAEELVAELTAAFLCAHLSIPGQLRHAEYIGAWLSLLKEDKRAVFTAAAKATQASEYLKTLTETEPTAGEA